jgi:hypothetical protein
MSLLVRSQPRDASRWSGLESLLSGWDDLLSAAGAFTPLADVEETDEAYVAERKRSRRRWPTASSPCGCPSR